MNLHGVTQKFTKQDTLKYLASSLCALREIIFIRVVPNTIFGMADFEIHLKDLLNEYRL